MRCLIGSQCNFLSSIGACDMFKFWCICNDTSQNLLNALYFVQVCLRNAIVEWIAIIKLFAGDEWIDIFARKIALANVRGVRESHSPCAGEWTKWLHWLLNALSAATNWWRPALCAFVAQISPINFNWRFLDFTCKFNWRLNLIGDGAAEFI